VTLALLTLLDTGLLELLLIDVLDELGSEVTAGSSFNSDFITVSPFDNSASLGKIAELSLFFTSFDC
jgi:hypothetical protein